MTKNKISVYVLYVSILTFISIFLFISVKGYENLVGTTKTTTVGSIGKSINLGLKVDIIDLIESRQKFEPIFTP